eukprot:COSAG01_NODE_2106_length_8416_cov_47.839485_8_plen_197_part_00
MVFLHEQPESPTRPQRACAMIPGSPLNKNIPRRCAAVSWVAVGTRRGRRAVPDAGHGLGCRFGGGHRGDERGAVPARARRAGRRCGVCAVRSCVCSMLRASQRRAAESLVDPLRNAGLPSERLRDRRTAGAWAVLASWPRARAARWAPVCLRWRRQARIGCGCFAWPRSRTNGRRCCVHGVQKNTHRCALSSTTAS